MYKCCAEGITVAIIDAGKNKSATQKWTVQPGEIKGDNSMAGAS